MQQVEKQTNRKLLTVLISLYICIHIFNLYYYIHTNSTLYVQYGYSNTSADTNIDTTHLKQNIAWNDMNNYWQVPYRIGHNITLK